MNKVKTLRTNRPIILKWLQSYDPSTVPRLLNFLRKQFVPNEPIFRSVSTTADDINAFEDMCVKQIEKNSSVIVLDAKDESIVGCLLNDIHDRNGSPIQYGVDKKHKLSHAHRRSYELYAEIKNEIDFFAKYPKANRIMEHTTGCVHSKWASDGIAYMLLKYSGNVIAPKMNCNLLTAFSSNYYTARLAEKYGFKTIWSKKITDITDGGKVLFPVEPPHEYFAYLVHDCTSKSNK